MVKDRLHTADRQKKVFVTGATGFVGGALLKALSSRGRPCKALVRRTGKAEALRHLNVELVYGNLLDLDSLKEALSDVDVVYHCAGYVKERPLAELMNVNVLGTENICEAALWKGVGKMIYVSSLSVINGNEERPLREEFPYATISNYGLSKIEGEKIALQYRNKGLRVAIFRPSTIYGPGEPHFLDLTARLMKRRWMFVVGEGKQRWQLVYIGDLVDVLMSAEDREPAFQQIYNLAGEEISTRIDVYSEMARLLGVGEPWHMPHGLASALAWSSEMLRKSIRMDIPFDRQALMFLSRDWCCDISRAKRELDYRPRVGLKEGLQRSLVPCN